MLILKAPAVIAAVLFISSVSAQAMEFADRPGPVSGTFNSPSTLRAIASEDRLRRQVNNYLVLLPVTATGRKLADRQGPVSNLIRIQVARMMFEDRPGRLSAEFSAVSVGSGIKFEHRPWMVSRRVEDISTPVAKKFEDRPGPMSNRFKMLANLSIKFADRRGFTSSLAKTKTPLGLHVRPSAVEFCVGSIAPCGPLNFAQRPEKHS